MSLRHWEVVAGAGVLALTIVALTELVSGVTILGDVQPLLLGLLILPTSIAIAHRQRLLGRVCIAGALLLILSSVGDLLT